MQLYPKRKLSVGSPVHDILRLCLMHNLVRANTLRYFSDAGPRQTELSSKYSFTCSCHSCSLPTVESTQSDTRRKMLEAAKEWFRDKLDFHVLERVLKIWAADPSFPDNFIDVATHQFHMRLRKEEDVFQDEVVVRALCGCL